MILTFNINLKNLKLLLNNNMIKFDLICENEHIFEASFDDSRSYEIQRKKKLIECPFCMSIR